MSPEARIPRRGFADYPQRQVLSAIWPSSNPEQLTKQYEAALAGMAGIGPGDEIEGMLAAQMVATHSAAMECYRRAMLDNQTFEGRRESLSQASKLIRAAIRHRFARTGIEVNRHAIRGPAPASPPRRRDQAQGVSRDERWVS